MPSTGWSRCRMPIRIPFGVCAVATSSGGRDDSATEQRVVPPAQKRTVEAVEHAAAVVADSDCPPWTMGSALLRTAP